MSRPPLERFLSDRPQPVLLKPPEPAVERTASQRPRPSLVVGHGLVYKDLRYRSWTLFVVPLSAIFLWLLVPLRTDQCEESNVQSFPVYMWLLRPLYMLGALLVGRSVFAFMVPLPPPATEAACIAACVLLDASLSTVLVLALNHLSEVEKKLFTFASIIVSATPYLALVGIALARRRRQLAAEGASEPNPPRALQPADATLRVGDVRSVDCRALMFAYLIVAGVILTYLACVSFATFYTTRTVQDRETFKIAFSSIYLYMLMPLLEQVMMTTVAQLQDYAGAYRLRVLIKFAMDLFYFLYYRALQTSFSDPLTFALVETQSIVVEVVRYPLRITPWYVRQEVRLARRIGKYARTKMVVSSGALLLAATALILFTGDDVAAVVAGYSLTLVSVVALRVGLGFKLIKNFPLDEVAAASAAAAATPAARAGASSNSSPRPSSLASSSADPLLVESEPGPPRSLRAPSVSVTAAAAAAAAATMEEPREAEQPDYSVPQVFRDFQRSVATEYFFRKRARQLALVSLIAFTPWLRSGYNSAFYPYSEERIAFIGDDARQQWGFFAAMVALDLIESAFSRVVFNRTTRIDTFVDSLALLRPAKAAFAFTVFATHILSDIYVALNRFRFCARV